jgi:hypothetical protein
MQLQVPSACAGSIVSNPSPDLLLDTPASICHPYLPASFSPLNSWVPFFRFFPSFSADVPFVQFFYGPFPHTDFIILLLRFAPKYKNKPLSQHMHLMLMVLF